MTGDGSLSVAERLERIEATQQETLDMVREVASHDRADLLRYQYLAERLDEVEAWQTWAMRLVLGLVAAAVVGGVVVVS